MDTIDFLNLDLAFQMLALEAAGATSPLEPVEKQPLKLRQCKVCGESEIPGTHLVYNLCRECRENQEEKEWSWGR